MESSFEASAIVDKDKTVEGDEFVVIGVTTPETATKPTLKNIKGVTFTDPIPEVNKVIEEFKLRLVQKVRTTNTMLCWLTWVWDTTTPVEWRGSTLAEAFV